MTDKTIDELSATPGSARTDEIPLWDVSAAGTVKDTLADVLALALSTDISDSTATGRAVVTAASQSAGRTALGLGTIATQASSSVSITGGSVTGITDIVVADGGTGVSTLTGLAKGNGTSAFTAAAEGTDYYKPGGTDVAVADGGSGSSTASGARTNFGLGTIATQDASAVAITGGSITGITDLAVADGGTGGGSVSTAQAGLGRTKTRLGADMTAVTSATLADIVDTGAVSLGTAVTSGLIYEIRGYVLYRSNNTAGGAKFSATWPTAGYLALSWEIPDAAPGVGSFWQERQIVSGTGVAATGTPATNATFVARVWGLYKCNASGTFQLQVASTNGSAAVTVKEGSILILEQSN